MTDKQKAEYYDQWKDYFESLARIRREVKQAEPHCKKQLDQWERTYISDKDALAYLIINDDEVLPELENLIQIMLNND